MWRTGRSTLVWLGFPFWNVSQFVIEILSYLLGRPRINLYIITEGHGIPSV